MLFPLDPTLSIWGIAAVATGGVILRPWQLPEAVWAVIGASALVAFGLFPFRDAPLAVGKGMDVYLFLIGMMLVAELARREGLFEWMAVHAVRAAHGSARRLFALIYGVDLGHNLSATGSLATILWLVTLRRENVAVSAWQFFRLGIVVLPPAFVLPIASTMWL